MPLIDTFFENCEKRGGLFYPGSEYPINWDRNTTLFVVSDLSCKTLEKVLIDVYEVQRAGSNALILSSGDGEMKADVLRKRVPLIVYPEMEEDRAIAGIMDGLFSKVIVYSVLNGAIVEALNGSNIPVWWIVRDGRETFSRELSNRIPYFVLSNVSVVATEEGIMQELLNLRPNYTVKTETNYIYDIINASNQIQESDSLCDLKAVERILYEDLSRRDDREKANQIELIALQNKVHDLEERCNGLRKGLEDIENSTMWKLSKPAQRIVDFLRSKSASLKARTRHNLLKKDKKTVTSLTEGDLPPKTRYRITQGEDLLKSEVVISVIVPLFNTDSLFLRQMIESVEWQKYPNWELCLADGSDSDHDNVGRICMEYAEKDQRIRYKKLEDNLGISGNSNAAIGMTKGDYIALLDHDDVLHPDALNEVIRAIVEEKADFIYTDEAIFRSPDINDITFYHYKPDYAPDNMFAYNYICHFTVFNKSLLTLTGGFRREYDGAQDYDLILRLLDVSQKIVHIPQILYFWRAHPKSTAFSLDAKDYAIEAGRKAIQDCLDRRSMRAEAVESAVIRGLYRVKYEVTDTPLISIIIPSSDHTDDLKKCIESIETKSTYSNYEIIVVDNNSKEKTTYDCYQELLENHEKIKVVEWKGPFNYSTINNYAVDRFASGDHIILLNNDTQIITADWMEQMLMYSQRKDVGAVGAMLYYPDDTVQHAGIVIGMGGAAAHIFANVKRGEIGYANRLCFAQDLSAVTGACLMVRRDVWDKVGGLNMDYAVAYNDTDFCMRIRKAGYLIIWTPYAELYHYESKSRGYEDTMQKKMRFWGERSRLIETWKTEIEKGDPYFNPNFTLWSNDFRFKTDPDQE